MTLYLIRHGKTAANQQGCYCGSTDQPLSQQGREELQNKRYDISDVRFLTSGMRRANETMELLFDGVDYEIDPRFREVDFGVFEMHTYEELKDEPAYQAWITGDNETNIPPQGESGAQMKARVLEALSELTDDACLITHGGVIAAIMAHIFPQEEKSRYDWQPQNGEGYVIEKGRYRAIK